MTTVALLRTNYLNDYLRRLDDGAQLSRPWSNAQADQAIVDALTGLWADEIGKRATGIVATSQASDVYTVPAALAGGRIIRIDLEQVTGGVTRRVGRVTSFIPYSDTEVRVNPLLPTDTTLRLRFFGWIPFLVDASDLPVRLEPMVAAKAASLAYGQELGQLANSQTQQGLDSGRVVDYPAAVGLSAYWERRYVDAIERENQYRVGVAPRAARR